MVVVLGVITVILLVLMFVRERMKAWTESYLPERAHLEDAGMDLKSPVDVVIPQGESVNIDTGVHLEIPKGYFGKLESKSGLNVNHGIVSLGGVIDSGYRGSIVVRLYNLGNEDYHISKGDKIVQLIIIPCCLAGLKCVSEEEWKKKTTKRGNNGFGSTGK